MLLTGNTMSQSVRERISQLAVLKTLGFADRTVLGIVLSEWMVVPAMASRPRPGLAGRAGLAQQMAAFLQGIFLSPGTMAVAMMAGAGIVAGIFPALKAMRLWIVDALARALNLDARSSSK